MAHLGEELGGSDPLLGKKGKLTEGRKADRESQAKSVPPSPLPIAQGLDSPLVTALICQHQTHRTLFSTTASNVLYNRYYLHCNQTSNQMNRQDYNCRSCRAWRETVERKTVFHCLISSSPQDSDIFASRHFPNPLLLLDILEKKWLESAKTLCFYAGSFFRAMSSPTNKEQFLKQFDSIVRGIVDNKERVGQPSMCFPALATGFVSPRL